MYLNIITYPWVILLASIICLVSSQEDKCDFDPPLCDVQTRLPGFIPSDCSHPCNFNSSDGGCQLDGLCFFKSVVGLVQPAGYEHLLNLSSVETVQDAEGRVADMINVIGEEKKELDRLAEIVAASYLQFYKDNFSGTNESVLPDEINNLTCSGVCKSIDNYGECKVNATCYFQNKLEQSDTLNNSPLLSLSSNYNDFDEYSLVKELFDRIKGEKIKLDTFSRFTINIFNIMIDIEVSNGNSGIVLRYGCFPIAIAFGGPGFVAGLRSSCSGVCMNTASNGDCVQDLGCLFKHVGYNKE